MDLTKLFPNSAKKKNDDKYINMFYITMVEWGWSYSQLLETPIPMLNLLLKKHMEVTKKNNKKGK
jgi:hypothetical protein